MDTVMVLLGRRAQRLEKISEVVKQIALKWVFV
jgi:hypothetical protein